MCKFCQINNGFGKQGNSTGLFCSLSAIKLLLIASKIPLALHIYLQKTLQTCPSLSTLLSCNRQRNLTHTYPKEPARRFLPSRLPGTNTDISIFKTQVIQFESILLYTVITWTQILQQVMYCKINCDHHDDQSIFTSMSQYKINGWHISRIIREGYDPIVMKKSILSLYTCAQ